MPPFYRRFVLALGAWLWASSVGAAQTEGTGERSPSLDQAYCHANELIYGYNKHLDRMYGIGYEDSLHARAEVVAKQPMTALTALPGQGESAKIVVPAGARVVVAERVPLESPNFYRVTVPQQGLADIFMATDEFSQFATIENQIKHRDWVDELRNAFIDRIDRELLAPLGVTYEMLYRMYDVPGRRLDC